MCKLYMSYYRQYKDMAQPSRRPFSFAYGNLYKESNVIDNMEQAKRPQIQQLVCCGRSAPLWHVLFVFSIFVNFLLSVSLLSLSIELQNKVSSASVGAGSLLSTVECRCSGLSHQGNALICEYDLECVQPLTYGCNAGGVQMCRFCNTDGFMQCKHSHPPPPLPPELSPVVMSPPPTIGSIASPPSADESACTCTGYYNGVRQTCKYDPSCQLPGVSLGCNAQGMSLCRYCGFGSFSAITCEPHTSPPHTSPPHTSPSHTALSPPLLPLPPPPPPPLPPPPPPPPPQCDCGPISCYYDTQCSNGGLGCGCHQDIAPNLHGLCRCCGGNSPIQCP